MPGEILLLITMCIRAGARSNTRVPVRFDRAAGLGIFLARDAVLLRCRGFRSRHTEVCIQSSVSMVCRARAVSMVGNTSTLVAEISTHSQ